jgi:hypothetical protein
MNCKHRWVEVNWLREEYRKPNEFVYHCTRCYQCRFAQLIAQEKSPGLVSRG